MLAYTKFPNNFRNESHTADHVCRYAIHFISKYKPLDRTNKVRFVCGGSSLTSGQLILALSRLPRGYVVCIYLLCHGGVDGIYETRDLFVTVGLYAPHLAKNWKTRSDPGKCSEIKY